MNYKQILFLSQIMGIIFFFGCSPSKSTDVKPHVEVMKSPAGASSSEPDLHVGIDGNVYLSWVEIDEDTTTSLCYSTIRNNEWSELTKVLEGDNWFLNWADFPSISSFGSGSIAAHFLVESEEDDYAYDVNISISNDEGLSWNRPFTPHQDSTPTEHGFVSMLPYEDQILAVWLDGRNYSIIKENDTVPSDEMTLRSAVIDKNGQLSNELVIDARVCSCCQTDAALISTGPILVFRDRSEKEIRDISVVRLINGKWTIPQAVFRDNWEIAGCPVNGPAIEAKDELVAVAWFTAANDVPKIKIAFSINGGSTFDEAIVVSDRNPSGRVDLILLEDGSALMSWLESTGDETMIKARRIYQDGSFDETIVVARSSESRSSGFPKMVMKNDMVYFAWTETGGTLSVKTAYLKLSKD
jgi:hypothetical protein